MDKIYLVIESYGDEDGPSMPKITPCKTREKAKEIFDAAVEKDLEDHPDTVQSHTEDYYENYEDECFTDGWSVIYIDEKEITE